MSTQRPGEVASCNGPPSPDHTPGSPYERGAREMRRLIVQRLSELADEVGRTWESTKRRTAQVEAVMAAANAVAMLPFPVEEAPACSSPREAMQRRWPAVLSQYEDWRLRQATESETRETQTPGLVTPEGMTSNPGVGSAQCWRGVYLGLESGRFVPCRLQAGHSGTCFAGPAPRTLAERRGPTETQGTAETPGPTETRTPPIPSAAPRPNPGAPTPPIPAPPAEPTSSCGLEERSLRNSRYHHPPSASISEDSACSSVSDATALRSRRAAHPLEARVDSSSTPTPTEADARPQGEGWGRGEGYRLGRTISAKKPPPSRSCDACGHAIVDHRSRDEDGCYLDVDRLPKAVAQRLRHDEAGPSEQRSSAEGPPERPVVWLRLSLPDESSLGSLGLGRLLLLAVERAFSEGGVPAGEHHASGLGSFRFERCPPRGEGSFCADLTPMAETKNEREDEPATRVASLTPDEVAWVDFAKRARADRAQVGPATLDRLLAIIDRLTGGPT